MAIESPLQRFIVKYLKKIGASQRKFGTAMDLSETTFGTYNRMSSAMGLDTLDKILTTYPSTREALIDYLRGSIDEKPTQELKNMEWEKLMEDMKIKEGMIRFLDDKKTEIQRKLDLAESEVQRLTKENQSLRDRLDKATAIDGGKK